MMHYAMEVLLRSERDTEWDIVTDSYRRLEGYILGNSYRGYDPYDGLMSPLFRLPLLRSNRKVRWMGQQVIRRLPVNIRPALGIAPGYNPVTLALCLQAYAMMAQAMPEERERYLQEMSFLRTELERMQSRPYHGACWGYDFDWEARYARFPAAVPTVVATGIVSNALFAMHAVTGDEDARALCVSAAQFVLHDLRRIEEDGAFCFSYSPNDTNVVLNATMKGARILAQAFALTGDPVYKETARNTIQFVVRHQRDDGAWRYSLGDSRSWADNFHTGYVLDCLQEYCARTGDTEFEESRQRGLDFYLHHFLGDGGIPRYYDTSLYPVDSTAGAQCIITLVRNGMLDRALSVALWMVHNMQDPDGYFYYQKHRHWTVRIPYMRWSNAWMLMALAHLLEHRHVLA